MDCLALNLNIAWSLSIVAFESPLAEYVVAPKVQPNPIARFTDLQLRELQMFFSSYLYTLIRIPLLSFLGYGTNRSDTISASLRCLKQLPPTILSVVLPAAKPAPDHRKQQEQLAIRELHAQTLPGSVGERHYVTLELRILDKTLGTELHGIFKDVWVEMDKW